MSEDGNSVIEITRFCGSRGLSRRVPESDCFPNCFVNRNAKKSNFGMLKLQAFGVGLLLGCVAIAGTANAATLPKGNCVDPKPYTDLRHCRFEAADLRNRNLEGVDMRNVEFFNTQLQGANLTNALVNGRLIAYANLDGVKGLPEEGMAIVKNKYLVTRGSKTDLAISLLTQDVVTKGTSNIAGLSNIYLAKKVAGTQSTVALLSLPRYGDGEWFEAIIVARFDDQKFNLPACYRSMDVMNDGQDYHGPLLDSMNVSNLGNGNYGIVVKITGGDSDEDGVYGWDKVVILNLSPTCKLTLVHGAYENRSADLPENNHDSEWSVGGALDYRFIDDETVEIKTTHRSWAPPKKIKSKISYKQIKLNLHH